MTEVIPFIDIHSHIIYGADDGAESMTEAIRMLQADRDQGAAAVFATPHYGRENNNYLPKAAGVREKFELLKERAAEEVPEIRLYLGTEWYCAWDLADRVFRMDAFRMNGTSYVLAEFLEYGSRHERPEKIRTNLAQLQKRGLKPILAHPERYRALQDDRDLVRELADSGVLMQVNAFDLERNLNPVTRELAQWMARKKLIAFIGSDMHGMRPGARRPVMQEGVRWLFDNVEEEYALDVTVRNAEKLLNAAGNEP